MIKQEIFPEFLEKRKAELDKREAELNKRSQNMERIMASFIAESDDKVISFSGRVSYGKNSIPMPAIIRDALIVKYNLELYNRKVNYVGELWDWVARQNWKITIKLEED